MSNGECATSKLGKLLGYAGPRDATIPGTHAKLSHAVSKVNQWLVQRSSTL